MSIAEKLTAIAENEPKVYEAGKTAEWNAFWDSFQENGDRIDYTYGFCCWTNETFKPKYDIIVSKGVDSMFYGCKVTNLAQRLKDCGVTLDFSKIVTKSAYRVFMYANTTHLPIMDWSSATGLNQTCRNCTNLVSIEKLIVTQDCDTYNNVFGGCTKLVTLIVEGTIAANGFDVSDCTKLSHESLMSIINALKDFSGDTGTHTCTLGTTNLAKLTDAEKAIATEKGWTLA